MMLCREPHQICYAVDSARLSAITILMLTLTLTLSAGYPHQQVHPGIYHGHQNPQHSPMSKRQLLFLEKDSPVVAKPRPNEVEESRRKTSKTLGSMLLQCVATLVQENSPGTVQDVGDMMSVCKRHLQMFGNLRPLQPSYTLYRY